MKHLTKQPSHAAHAITSRLVARLVVAAFAIASPVTAWATASSQETSGDRRPNVVFILADDLGWADTTLYGHTNLYRTPNLERLAARGMTFSRAYAASPLCSPTRSAVLTGLSPARTGITAPTAHTAKVVLQPSLPPKSAPNQFVRMPASVSRLATDTPTLVRSLTRAGYTAGHFGKWHLGPEPYSPLEHGFSIDLPHHAGPGPAGSYVAPWRFRDFDHDPGVPDQHIEDRMADEAVQWMTRHVREQPERPFFLNYWMFSVHAPFDAKAELIERYRAVVDPAAVQRCPTYAAMVESMDDAVGTLLDALDQLGVAEQTVVIFHSDNGGNMYSEVDGTVPTSNAPLRGGKATMYEGGVRVPTMAIVPGLTTPGTRSSVLIQSEDFYPTLLEHLEIAPAPSQVFDGVSLVPALRGDQLERDAIFQYFPHSPPVSNWMPPSVSVHRGDWKLIRLFHAGSDGAHRYKLFNLADDIGEENNLAEQRLELVAELDQLIERFLTRTEARRPLPNPAFDPTKYDLSREGKGRTKKAKRPVRAPKASLKAGPNASRKA